MKFGIFSIACLLAFACSQPAKVNLSQIDAEEAAGNFTKATQLIDLYMAQNDLSEEVVYQFNWRKEKMHRIALDFHVTKEAALEYIRKYYPDVNDDSLARWEAEKSLEFKLIDGEKRYFDRGAPNLFRLDKYAVARKAEMTTDTKDVLNDTLNHHIQRIVDNIRKHGGSQTAPVAMKIKYSVTLKPDVVPDGETVSCWLPFPREDNRRQSEVKLLSVNDSNYIVSPNDYHHKTVYMQKTARQGEPLKFEITFSYRAVGEWFDPEHADIKPYRKEEALYKEYIAERPPHVVFTDSIKSLSARLIGDEKNPYLIARKIFEYVDIRYPWAGAREYATIDNIPLYVMENGHGDCGQVTLLFITLARYNGIPARWQSGFMLHPGRVNLHDWGEYYLEGIGWIPVDQSFGLKGFDDTACKYFYASGMDSYRMVVNNDYAMPLFPAKIYPRSDDVDFQRGELEWRGGNLYYDKWKWNIEVEKYDYRF
ncbi:MAG: transglutaminase domain-containing protein [Dysgonamonadaceae bacterium]|jgi:transglutaminase-like putative cysteine protease|nr:transglutaminase domain-containing protein [Dysgonamonadaceae bacterium]